MRTTIVSDIHAVAAMADNLLCHGVALFKSNLIREIGQYLVSWELDDEGLHDLEGYKQPDYRDNRD